MVEKKIKWIVIVLVLFWFAMQKNISYEINDYGNDHYVITMSGTNKMDYKKYLRKIKKEGFKKHSDNGSEAMEGNVMTSSYFREEIIITVSHVIRAKKTYISISKRLQLSDHLIYSNQDEQAVKSEGKSTLHMMQLNNNGACFIIRLKNGHFVIHDGGYGYDAPYLLDYLEKLTVGEGKPIIEAWFISHAHADHHGALLAIIREEKWRSRVYVDGVYFMEPPKEFIDKTKYESYDDLKLLMQNYSLLTTSVGGNCKLYRPQIGQRYYFDDIYIDVALTPEQFVMESDCRRDFNETSVWLMNYIEGQKILIVGDTNDTGMNTAIDMFDPAYFKMDVYAVSHHGVNVYDFFTDILKVNTILYSNWRVGSLWQDGSKYARNKENEKLIASAKEAYSHANGTVVLVFPYKIGSAKIMGQTKWKYNGGRCEDVFG